MASSRFKETKEVVVQIKDAGEPEKASLWAEFWHCTCGVSGTAPIGKTAQEMATSHFFLKHGAQVQEERRQRDEAFIEKNKRSMGILNQIRDKNETFLGLAGFTYQAHHGGKGPLQAPPSGKVRK